MATRSAGLIVLLLGAVMMIILGYQLQGRSNMAAQDKNVLEHNIIQSMPTSDDSVEGENTIGAQIIISSQVNKRYTKIYELVKEAQSYLEQKDYEQAIKISETILSKFDANSLEAQNIIQAAREEIRQIAENKIVYFRE